jgi:Mg-chelatase subunit ChlD
MVDKFVSMSIWNILLVDASASMTSNVESVNKGIVDLFVEQKENKDRFTFLTFNTDITCVIDAEFNEINCENIIRNIVNHGLTALYDAVGHVYEMVLNDCSEYVNITVITDGHENSSKNHTLTSLKTLREKIDKMCNINVTFICENENVLNNNSAIISHANESCEVSGDYTEAFRTVSRTMSSVRYPSAASSCILDEGENEDEVAMSEPLVKRQMSYGSKKRPRLFF